MIKKIKSKSEFSRNVLTLMTGTTIAQAIPIAISPILTRLYTPEEFGVLTLFLAILGVLSVMASGRYELAILLPAEKKEAMEILVLAFSLLSIVTMAVTLLIGFFHEQLVNLFHNEEIGFWLYFIPVALFFTGLFNILTYFNNREKFYKDIANAAVIKSIVLSSIQLIVGYLYQGAVGLISGQIISTLFANVRLLKNLLKEKRLLRNIHWTGIVKAAKKYKNFPKFQAPHAVLNTFSSYIPVYFFSVFFTSTIVGLYALSIRIVFTPLMIISGASSKVYNQKVIEMYKQQGNIYEFTVRLLISILKKIIIPFILLILFAPDIFAFIFGLTWREAGVFTQILSPWLLMVFVVSIVAYIPNLVNLQKKALWIEMIYTGLRVMAIGIGIYLQDVYLALVLFSVVGFSMLSYNLYWMLSALKRVY